MQYKIHPTKSDWSPDEEIELQKCTENGEPLLPKGVPNVLPYFEYLKDHEKVIEGLQTFVDWWKCFVDTKGTDFAYATWIRPIAILGANDCCLEDSLCGSRKGIS